jgi:hypothetical protein
MAQHTLPRIAMPIEHRGVLSTKPQPDETTARVRPPRWQTPSWDVLPSSTETPVVAGNSIAHTAGDLHFVMCGIPPPASRSDRHMRLVKLVERNSEAPRPASCTARVIAAVRKSRQLIVKGMSCILCHELKKNNTRGAQRTQERSTSAQSSQSKWFNYTDNRRGQQ